MQQHKIDTSVLRAYGWLDLAEVAAPEYLDMSNEDDHRYRGRLFWCSATIWMVISDNQDDVW